MSDNGTADRARRAALDEVDRQERHTTRWLMLAAVAEGLGLVLYLVLMDFSDRLHWLILIAASLVYATLVILLMSLKVQVQSATRSILRAIEETGGGPGADDG